MTPGTDDPGRYGLLALWQWWESFPPTAGSRKRHRTLDTATKNRSE